MSGLQSLLKKIVASRDVRTSRKLLAFVSDDWGCSRIRSKVDREALLGAGLKLDSNRFDKFDMLESNDDMERLLELVSRFKDASGNPLSLQRYQIWEILILMQSAVADLQLILTKR